MLQTLKDLKDLYVKCGTFRFYKFEGPEKKPHSKIKPTEDVKVNHIHRPPVINFYLISLNSSLEFLVTAEENTAPRQDSQK